MMGNFYGDDMAPTLSPRSQGVKPFGSRQELSFVAWSIHNFQQLITLSSTFACCTARVQHIAPGGVRPAPLGG
jgi:hypothetical protein